MKRMDIFCASQASIAICLSMDQASCSSSNTILLRGRAIDRHNPIINDSRRSTSKSLTAPCSSSQSPINPKSYHELRKAKKNSIAKNATKGHDNHKKNTAENIAEHVTNSSKPIDGIVRRSLIKPPSDLITPHGSTRSLLSDSVLLDASSHYDPVLALSTTVNSKISQVALQDETIPVSKHSSSSHSYLYMILVRIRIKGGEN
ncbi:unnamed protein product [Sphenostylis stenocarpa]|uniref:Uncharacterized protein n=1 Tax=Sphenostylis stenocarpa TaxID=92480 RepID=A0AA86SHJ6_9FABA|nr:unnamed protein product [Sphenostylis stenocarpa]